MTDSSPPFAPSPTAPPAPALREGSVLRRAADVRYRRVEDEAVVIRQRSGEVLGLNEVGARVLEELDGERPVAELVDGLAAEFEVGREALARDVLAFLKSLLARGVVVAAGGAGGGEEGPGGGKP